MRELAVFYCPKCGHYAYYQTSRHPQCPRCGHEEAMYMVRMHYTEFMKMSYDERDEYLAQEILKTNPSLVERLTAPQKRYNSREIIAELNNVIMNLDTENKILTDTVKWMHDTIWDLMHEQRKQAREEARESGSTGSREDTYETCHEAREEAAATHISQESNKDKKNT